MPFRKVSSVGDAARDKGKSYAYALLKADLLHCSHVRPVQCPICFDLSGCVGVIHAHHVSYKPELCRHIIWCCRKCHGYLHQNMSVEQVRDRYFMSGS